MFQKDKLVKLIETDIFILGMRADGIAHFYLNDNIEITVELQDIFVKAYNDLKNDKPYPVLYEPGSGCSITKEARENAIILEDLTPICASAVIARNTAYQLIANFYIKFNKPKYPYKVFKNHEEALNWLKTFV
jgi:hypothetical protein